MSQDRSPSKLLTQAGDTSQLFELLLDSAPDAMIIVDEGGKISIVNTQAEKMFGYEREQMWGEDIELLVPKDLHSVHITERTMYLKNPSLRAMGMGRELLARRRDGSHFPVEVSLSPLKTESGVYVSSVIRDITARKKMNLEIIAARQEAERANKANSAFLAAASHDLRQPVQALSLLNGALRRTVTEPKALEMIDSQSQSLTAMTNLLNSLLDISRLDAGAVTPELEDFPINQIIDRLSAEFSRQALQKGLAFASAPCDAVVRSDQNLLSEVIQNFVSNGIRYTDRGKVTLGCEVTNGICCVKICDTGIGIEPDQIDMIFNEFHQCKTPGASNEGFGLGLAIVRRLGDLLGHDIEVDSTPGQGSCFSISVPVVGEMEEADQSSDASVTEEEAGKGSGFVILVEDDVQVASALTLLFEVEGYRVGVAASKSEALAILQHSATLPCLIVSDYHLIGRATGVETIAALREKIGKTTPAFIVTGDTSELVEVASSVPNSRIMSKPVNPDQLLKLAKESIQSGNVPR